MSNEGSLDADEQQERSLRLSSKADDAPIPPSSAAASPTSPTEGLSLPVADDLPSQSPEPDADSVAPASATESNAAEETEPSQSPTDSTDAFLGDHEAAGALFSDASDDGNEAIGSQEESLGGSDNEPSISGRAGTPVKSKASPGGALSVPKQEATAINENIDRKLLWRRPRVGSQRRLCPTKIPLSLRVDLAASSAESGDAVKFRVVRDASGEPVLDSEGRPVHESNTKMVRWSDGSWTLVVGTTQFECLIQNDKSVIMDDSNADILVCHAMASEKITLRPITAAGHHLPAVSVRPRDSALSRATQLASVPVEEPRGRPNWRADDKRGRNVEETPPRKKRNA